MKKLLAIILAILGIVVVIYLGSTKEAEIKTVNQLMMDTVITVMDEVPASEIEKMEEMSFDIKGTLDDVTNGEEVRGLITGGTATGLAQAAFDADKDMYNLIMTGAGLPDPVGEDFYEGWIVRRGTNFSVISTGVLTKNDGVYTNTFASKKDLLDHDFYVLTIEPNDGDPAPADHVIEGVME